MLGFIEDSIKRSYLEILFRANAANDDVQKFEDLDGYPTLILRDGTRLSWYGESKLPSMKKSGIPDGYQDIVLAYINRYKYPHYAPYKKIRTAFIPRKFIPFMIHPQHKNTIFDLPNMEAKVLRSELKLETGDRVLEIGPYIGFGTVSMSKEVGQEGRIVAVEADYSAFAILKKNIEQNELTNVEAIHCAIGEDDNEEVPLWKSGKQANSLIRRAGAKSQTVKMRKLTSVLEQTRLRPNFLILTINGHELKVLDSSKDLLDESLPLRIISPGWYKDKDGFYGPRIIKLLREFNFKVFHTKGMHIFAIKD